MSEEAKAELVAIDPEKYNLETASAEKVGEALLPMVVKREGLREEFIAVSAAGVAEDNIDRAKTLLKALVKTRTGIETIRKTQKDFSLQYGRFVDAAAKAETAPVVQMEDEVKKITKHHENLEKERKLKVHNERKAMALRLDPDDAELDYSRMTDETWEKTYENLVWLKEKRDSEAKKAEEERIAKEKEEAERIEAERVERERIEAENAKLKAEAEEREAKEAAAQAERDKVEKARVEKEAEEQKKRDAEAAKIEAEREKERKAAADKLAEEKAEREKVEAAAQKIREAEQKKRDDEHKAKEKEQNAKIAANQKKLAEEKAKREAIEAEAKAKAEAEAKAKADAEAREADTKHRKKINNGALEAFVALGASKDAAKAIVTAIAKGEVPAVRIDY